MEQNNQNAIAPAPKPNKSGSSAMILGVFCVILGLSIWGILCGLVAGYEGWKGLKAEDANQKLYAKIGLGLIVLTVLCAVVGIPSPVSIALSYALHGKLPF